MQSCYVHNWELGFGKTYDESLEASLVRYNSHFTTEAFKTTGEEDDLSRNNSFQESLLLDRRMLEVFRGYNPYLPIKLLDILIIVLFYSNFNKRNF